MHFWSTGYTRTTSPQSIRTLDFTTRHAAGSGTGLSDPVDGGHVDAVGPTRPYQHAAHGHALTHKRVEAGQHELQGEGLGAQGAGRVLRRGSCFVHTHRRGRTGQGPVGAALVAEA